MAHSEGLLSRARALDNRVLGSPDTKRGWFVNLLLGLNPYLFWVYVTAGVVDLVVLGLRLSDGGNWSRPAVNLWWLMVLAYVSRSLPRRWRGREVGLGP